MVVVVLLISDHSSIEPGMLKWAWRPAGAVRSLLIFANPPYTGALQHLYTNTLVGPHTLPQFNTRVHASTLWLIHQCTFTGAVQQCWINTYTPIHLHESSLLNNLPCPCELYFCLQLKLYFCLKLKLYFCLQLKLYFCLQLKSYFRLELNFFCLLLSLYSVLRTVGDCHSDLRLIWRQRTGTDQTSSHVFHHFISGGTLDLHLQCNKHILAVLIQ